MRVALALLIFLGSLSVSASELDDARALAQQGDVHSQFTLGMRYDAGIGTPVDHKEAVRWYRAAAEQGDAGGQYRLGFVYKNG